VHGRMDDCHAHGRCHAWRGWDACLACPAPPPLIPTPCVLPPSAGCCCDREPRRLQRHRQPADYNAIASTAPWLTHLSLELPASATALPQEMAGLLSACSNLEAGDLAVRAFDEARPGTSGGGRTRSSIANVDALAAGTQLLSLRLPWCSRLTSLAAIGEMVNLQSLDMRECRAVSDLAPFAAMVNLRTLNVSGSSAVPDLDAAAEPQAA
jgi:hypothetical protein